MTGRKAAGRNKDPPTIEDLYCNKNFVPPKEKSLETIFEEPKTSRNGLPLLTSVRKFRRYLHFDTSAGKIQKRKMKAKKCFKKLKLGTLKTRAASANTKERDATLYIKEYLGNLSDSDATYDGESAEQALNRSVQSNDSAEKAANGSVQSNSIEQNMDCPGQSLDVIVPISEQNTDISAQNADCTGQNINCVGQIIPNLFSSGNTRNPDQIVSAIIGVVGDEHQTARKFNSIDNPPIDFQLNSDTLSGIPECALTTKDEEIDFAASVSSTDVDITPQTSIKQSESETMDLECLSSAADAGDANCDADETRDSALKSSDQKQSVAEKSDEPKLKLENTSLYIGKIQKQKIKAKKCFNKLKPGTLKTRAASANTKERDATLYIKEYFRNLSDSNATHDGDSAEQALNRSVQNNDSSEKALNHAVQSNSTPIELQLDSDAASVSNTDVDITPQTLIEQSESENMDSECLSSTADVGDANCNTDETRDSALKSGDQKQSVAEKSDRPKLILVNTSL